MSNLKSRQEWVDIAKGLGIIAVVMGHSGNAVITHYLSWFHMPLFFMLSGYFFKPIEPKVFLSWCNNIAKRLLVPYFSYGIVIVLIAFGSNQHISRLLEDLINLVYGGVVLQGPYGVFWYITCLLLTQLLFGFISRFPVIIQVTVITTCYIAAHISAGELVNLQVPWNADVVLVSLAYYAIGFFAKGIVQKLLSSITALVVSILVSIIFISLDAIDVIDYNMILKNKVFTSLPLDIIVPMVMVFAICLLSYHLSRLRFSKPLTSLGSKTLTVMYLHLPANFFIKKFFHVEYGMSLFTVIGIASSLLAYYVFKRSNILSCLFLGAKPENVKLPLNNRPIEG